MSKVVYLFVLVVVLAACGRGTQSDKNLTMVDSLHHEAWRLQGMDDVKADSFQTLQQQAVDLLHQGSPSCNPVEVLTQAGFMYCTTGDYLLGMTYIQEAADTLSRHPELRETEGAIQLYGDMGSLYRKLGMYDKALKSNSQGILTSRALGGKLMSDLLRMRATIFESMNMPDSAMVCYAVAHMMIDSGDVNADRQYLHMIVDSEKADMVVEYPDLYGDSLQWAKKRLMEIVDYLKSRGDDSSNARFALGKAYSLLGQPDEGIPLMESVRNEWREEGDDEGVEYGTTVLMREYARHRMDDKLAASFDEYDAARDSLLNREKLDALIGAEINYQAERRIRENETLVIRLELSRKTTILLYVMLALAITVIVIIFQRVQKGKAERRAMEMQLHDTLTVQYKLNREIERINLLNEQARHSKTMENVKRELNPSVLSAEAERDFRRSFAALHPHFLTDLREKSRELTPNDELLCMLILMKMSTDEIALSLGISRQSVNSARYRLRKKFHLDKETDLDGFIQSHDR